MTFVLLTAVAGVAATGGLYALYNHYKADLTADHLIADFTGVVSKLEAYAESKVTEVEQYILQALHLTNLKTTAEAEAQKAKDYAAKIKGLFS